MSSIPDRPAQFPSGSGDAVLDAACLDRIRDLGGPEDPGLLLELIELYIEDAGRRMKDLASAMRQTDLEAVARAAHALKSSSANMGALVFADICRKIETRARVGESVDELVQQGQSAFGEVGAALRQLQTGC
jgi:HPt (histidine-containing phosphotransfer) domain-containing protein